MKSAPQTQPRTFTAPDTRRRAPGLPESANGSAPARARQAFPAVDPSTAFGCVDWFLYPDQATGQSAAA